MSTPNQPSNPDSAARNRGLSPPIAKRIPRITTIHGETLEDPWAWLRDKGSPEVNAYLEAENAWTEERMRPTRELQERLFSEMKSRIRETDLTVPYRIGRFLYYSRWEKGRQYPLYCRRAVDATMEEEELLLDLNLLARGLSYLAVGAIEISDDARLLAYSLDSTGYRQYTLHVKDLETGEVLPESIEKTRSVVWAADHRTLFYTREDSAKRPYRLYRHTLGESGPDALVYEERDALYSFHVRRSRSRGFIFGVSASATTNEIRILPADQPTDDFRLVAARREGHEYHLDHHTDRFFIRTNDQAVNFRLMTAPVSDPSPEQWRELIPHREEVVLERFDLFAGHCVMKEREKGLARLRVLDLASGIIRNIDFSEPAWSIEAEPNEEFSTTRFRYRYQSFITPDSVYEYDMSRGISTLLKRTEVLGGYDPSRYTTRRIEVTARDGTAVPVSLVYRQNLDLEGGHPLLLYGYGSYGFPLPVNFNSNRFSLIDRGVVWATAHIRGGGEMGQRWHDQGKMEQKLNTFTDFIDVAESLIESGFTRPDRLVIMGGSAGGLLVGAVANMRPELFCGVVALVPFVDVLNTMLDPSLPLTVGEYLEWGNPNQAEQYSWIRRYCPYTNLSARNYPDMFVRTSINDSQVGYWEGAKYVAKLRATATGGDVLLWTNMGAGHSGASGRYDRLWETAFDYAWILHELGITE